MRVWSSGWPSSRRTSFFVEEDRGRLLTVRAPGKEHERRVDPVDVVERVERELERLAPKELRSRVARLSSPIEQFVPEPAEAVLDGVARVDRRRCRRPRRGRAVVSGRTAMARTAGRSVPSSGPDRRALVRDRDERIPARKAVLAAHVIGDLRGALLGASRRLPRRPGGSGGGAPAADEDEQRPHAGAGDDREQDVERRKSASVGEAPRAVGARLRDGDDRRAPGVRRRRLRVGGGLVHHIVGHELSSARSTSGIAIFDSSSRFRSSSPKSSRRASSTSAMCSTASRFAMIRL